MQGRFVLFAKVLIASSVVSLMAGCQPPRIKSMESAQAATQNNPARDFAAAPIDTGSWGGIARATGGRDSRTTYGSLSAGGNDGVNEVYLPMAPSGKPADDTSSVYLVPDPRGENKAGNYVGSKYLDNDGNDITPKYQPMPPRAGAAPKAPAQPAGE